MTDGIINPVFGDIQWVIGDTSSASWAGKSGWVDAITVTTTTESATYDLEEGLGSCPVAIDTPNQTLTLTGDCTTSSTLTMHDGWTLDGAGHTITAIDPSPAVDFTGAVLTNVVPGARIDVTDVHIDGNLDSGCSSSLFGVRFEGAAGSFTHSTISDIKYGAGAAARAATPSTSRTGPGSGPTETWRCASPPPAWPMPSWTWSRPATRSRSVAELAYVSGNVLGGNDWDGNDQWNATGVLLYGAQDVTRTARARRAAALAAGCAPTRAGTGRGRRTRQWGAGHHARTHGSDLGRWLRATTPSGCSSTYVPLKGRATLVLSDTAVTAGTKVTFSGKAKPGNGSVAQLQRREATGWVTKKSVAPAANGSYALTWTPSSKTDYTWRVKVSGPRFTAGVSASKVLKVT